MEYISLTKGIKYTGFLLIDNGTRVVVYFENGYDRADGSTYTFEDQDEFYKTPEIMAEIAHALGGKYCWAKCYDAEGNEVLVENIFDSYELFYAWLDYEYGYDVIDDGDNNEE